MRALLLVLLLLGTLLPTVDAQSGAGSGNELKKDDNPGDVGVRGGPGPPGSAPANPVTDPFDLLSLRVYGEDLEGFHVDVQVKNLRRSAGYVWGGHRYLLDFRVEGGTASYNLEWIQVGYSGSNGNDTPTFGTRLCLRTQGEYGCNRQRSIGGADYAQNTLHAYLPKRALMGLDPVQGGRDVPTPIPIGVGSALGQFSVRSSADAHFLEDRLPDAGGVGPFIFQEPAANGRVGLALHKGNETKDTDPYPYYGEYGPLMEAGDFPRVPVEPGNATRVEVAATNRNGGKRLLNLEATIDDAEAKGRWEVRIAPSVQVPGNETRVVNLVVTADDKVEHRDSVLVRVVAKSAGFPDELGALTLRLVASAPVSVAHPTFYFHGARANLQAWDQAVCSTPSPYWGACRDRLWMNTLEEDPTANTDADGFRAPTYWSGQFANGDYVFNSDTKLTRDLVLDPRQPVKANLKVRAPNAAGSLDFTLLGASKSIGQVTVAVPAGSGGVPQDVAVSFLPLADAARIPAGSEMRIRIVLRFPTQTVATPATLIGKGSFVTLPAIEDPQAPPPPPVALGDAFLSLSLKGDAEEFMNPGKSKAYRLVLVNEGNLTDDARILANITQGGCGAALRPGDEFRLEAGDSVRVDVLVRVPDDAKEGSQCRTEVTAISGVDPAFKARVFLTTIATTGADFEDEAENYTADEDARSKLRSNESGSSTPGAGLLLVVAASAAGAVLRRRRLQP